jgi:DNA-binding transcriptional ArsR family regulator
MISTLNALAEPNRLRVVELLRGGPCSVNEIVERLKLSQPLVSKHLRVLSLVRMHPNAQQRIYELDGRAFQQLDGWLGTYRRLWETRLDSLDSYLQEVKEAQQRENHPHNGESPNTNPTIQLSVK